ncbi:hypothetical protein [Dechloromonas sp.]|uniref:hypothetical protein n=1 Tax=Dechloromonas sp. TaxID=1917218 RepID=UPI0012115CD0|nr:hypothetical protein [Dechloromonas sp.]MBU3697299.1 hypothetical protein [Dechloromonas sp.]TEX44429.1 MAG: hypothetical protein CFR70_13875 [Rhodocyclaceae bacterium]
MPFPEFFSRIPAITLHDPLAELLGSAVDGRLEYRFEDAVRLTGHACPTVAGAWLTGCSALQALYPDTLPVRGQIDVAFGEGESQGVTGVIASVLGLLIGAAGRGGFAGLGGHFRRRDLLQFGVDGVAQVRFCRRDTGQTADCRLSLAAVPGNPRTGEQLARLLAGEHTPELARAFQHAWLARVESILLDSALRPQLLDLRLGSS